MQRFLRIVGKFCWEKEGRRGAGIGAKIEAVKQYRGNEVIGCD